MSSNSFSGTDIEYYRRDGFVIVRKVFSRSEIDNLARDVDRVITENSQSFHSRNMRIRQNTVCGELVTEVIDPISDLSYAAKAICLDPRVTDRVASLYGEPACLFKDKFFCKPPGCDGIQLHQDWIAWPGFPKSFLTVLVAVDRFREESGATKVYPCSHHQGYMSNSDGRHHSLEHSQMSSLPVCLELDPGDIAIFGCFTPHYSEANRSDQARRAYFISFNSLSDGGDQWDSHYQEFHGWIKQRAPKENREQLVFI